MSVAMLVSYGAPVIMFAVLFYLVFYRRRNLSDSIGYNPPPESDKTAALADLTTATARVKEHAAKLQPEDVRKFYNETTDKFLEVYGEIIQAYRTTNVEDYLDYTIKSAGLADGQVILDAGCGVAGPARYFAKKLDVKIQACSISDVQVAMAKEKVKEQGLEDKIEVRRADYHDIDYVYGVEQFDRIIFLESFGHSNDKAKLITAAWKALKPGGQLYIKDLFEREAPNEADAARIKDIIHQINTGYQYAVGDMYAVLKEIRKLGFIINFVRVPEIDMSLFEHLTISNDFQNLFNISKIDSWENYVFPIDFYEIKCTKFSYDLNDEKHLYFMNRKDEAGAGKL